MDRPPLSKERTSDLAFLSGGGEMGALIRAKDWSNTPVGSPEHWPQALHIALRIVLDSRYQMFLWWGPELTVFNNDAYIPIHGARHPWALGQPAAVVWKEIWETLGPQTEAVLREKRASWNEDQLLIMQRNGYPEETFFSYSYSPVLQDDGTVGGVFCACTESTERVISERRLAVLRDLSDSTAGAESLEQVCLSVAATFRKHARDASFALLYLLSQDGASVSLQASTGIESENPMAPKLVVFDHDEQAASPWLFGKALHGGPIVIDDLRKRATLAGGVWPETTHTAMVLPLKGSQDQPMGFLVLGASPRRSFDDKYRVFFELAAGQVATALVNARAYEEEKARAEALAELDRAKTAFFSNVSHEFRTPLTLMLGPLEELKAQFGRSASSLSFSEYQQVDLAHRNGLRLLKLVNTLLDFSRIEAGRAQAVYEETDLAAFTADLTSVFRSTIEKAGLTLIVECPPLPESVFVDRDMWEKIVLNLLSNAFKFTFNGKIKVALRHGGEHVELSVRDTGTGIPDDQLGKIFERFHRVAGSQGRTYEGTGIGLSLVQELARLHGGSVSVESVYGKGSIFIVTIPFGTAHLPADRIGTLRRHTPRRGAWPRSSKRRCAGCRRQARRGKKRSSMLLSRKSCLSRSPRRSVRASCSPTTMPICASM